MSSKNKLDLLNADQSEDQGRSEESSNPKRFKKTFDRNNGQDRRTGGSEDRPAKKFIRRQEEEDDDSDVDDDEELKISREDIDFNLPKPGPHAKVASDQFFEFKSLRARGQQFFSLFLFHTRPVQRMEEMEADA